MFDSIGKYTYGTTPHTCQIDTFSSADLVNYPEFVRPKVTIGAFSSIGINTKIIVNEGCGHDWRSFTSYPFGNIHTNIFNNLHHRPILQTKGGVHIGNDVWIGRDTTIMSGVTIGDGAIIAMNSHIYQNVPQYAIMGGNPVKLIKYRFSDDIIFELLNLKWWDLPDDMINQILPLLQQNPTMELITQIKQILNK